MAWRAGCLRPRSPNGDLCKKTTPPRSASTTIWSGRRARGVLVVLQVVHKTLFAPLIITVATNAAFAAVTAAFLTHLVVRLGQIKKDRGEALLAASWAHPLGLLMAVLISLAL